MNHAKSRYIAKQMIAVIGINVVRSHGVRFSRTDDPLNSISVKQKDTAKSQMHGRNTSSQLFGDRDKPRGVKKVGV